LGGLCFAGGALSTREGENMVSANRRRVARAEQAVVAALAVGMGTVTLVVAAALRALEGESRGANEVRERVR
jgi:hypothetical protein